VGCVWYVRSIASPSISDPAYIAFSNKILTSSRNRELVMWDLIYKPGSSKVGQLCSKHPLSKPKTQRTERRTKYYIRSIHQLSISSIVHYYCVTGGADGDVRVWVSFLSSLCFFSLFLSFVGRRGTYGPVCILHRGSRHVWMNGWLSPPCA
jgi:WD40 repeat protein